MHQNNGMSTRTMSPAGEPLVSNGKQGKPNRGVVIGLSVCGVICCVCCVVISIAIVITVLILIGAFGSFYNYSYQDTSIKTSASTISVVSKCPVTISVDTASGYYFVQSSIFRPREPGVQIGSYEDGDTYVLAIWCSADVSTMQNPAVYISLHGNMIISNSTLAGISFRTNQPLTVRNVQGYTADSEISIDGGADIDIDAAMKVRVEGQRLSGSLSVKTVSSPITVSTGFNSAILQSVTGAITYDNSNSYLNGKVELISNTGTVTQNVGLTVTSQTANSIVGYKTTPNRDFLRAFSQSGSISLNSK